MATLNDAKAAAARAHAALDAVAERALLRPGDIATLRGDVDDFDEALKELTDAPTRVLDIMAGREGEVEGLAEVDADMARSVATINEVSGKLEAMVAGDG